MSVQRRESTTVQGRNGVHIAIALKRERVAVRADRLRARSRKKVRAARRGLFQAGKRARARGRKRAVA
eukprot:3140995-Pleurochrysis_carterae.AAC.7